MTDDAQKRNPASRLIDILGRARNVKPETGVTPRAAWCSVFDISNVDSDEALFSVLECLVALRRLFNETVDLLKQAHNIDEELFVTPVERLARVVDLNKLHADWEDYWRYIHPTDIHSLHYCEHFLAGHPEQQENEIPDAELQEILSEINNLYESIMALSLPIELKKTLLDLIQEIRKAIHLYRVNGAEAFRDALTRSMGIIVANKETLEENKEVGEVQSLMNMLVRIDKMYTFAMKVKPLLEAAANIVPALAAHIK